MLMKNNFQSNGKGRNQRVWQLLISMLIIFTMGIGQMWGISSSATNPATTTRNSQSFLNVADTWANARIKDADSTLAYSVGYIKSTLDPAWYSGGKSNSSFTYPNAVDEGFIASSGTGGANGNGYYSIKSSQTATIYATGFKNLGVMGSDNSSTKYIVVEVEEYATDGTCSNKVSFSSSNKGTSITTYNYNFTPTKFYKITVTSNSTSGSKLYQVRFIRPSAPSALVASAPTSAGATLTVTDAENINNYEFYVSENSEAPTASSTATHSVSGGKTKVIDDLSAGTTYYAWVRSNCNGGKSTWKALTGNTFETASGGGCAATAPGNLNKSLPSAGEITLTAEGSAASGDTWYWQTAADGEDDTDEYDAVNGKAVNAAGTYYIRSYNAAGTCWSSAKSVTVAAEDLLTAINPSLSYDKTTLVLAALTTASPTLTGNDGNGTVSYALNNVNPAGCMTVDAGTGVVTAVAAGTATVTATIAANGNYAGGEATSGTIKVVAAPAGMIDQKLATGSVAWDASVIVTEDYTNVTGLTALSQHGSATASGNGNTSNGGQTSKVGTVTGDFNGNNYLELSFTIADGKEFNITSVAIPVQPVTSDANYFKAVLSDNQGSTAIEGTKTNITNGNLANIDFSSYGTLSGTITLRIYAWGWGNGYRLGKNIVIDGTISEVDVTAPTLSSSVPANSATGIDVSGNIVLTMSENVTIADASKFSLTGGTGSLTVADISVSGAVITIPYTGLANNTDYTFTAAAGAIKDGSNNLNAAFTIDFKTAASGVCVKPDAPIGLGVDVKTNNYAKFSWDGKSAGTNGYQIALTSEAVGATGKFDWKDEATAIYEATNLTPATEYTFKVKYKGTVDDCFSDEVTETFITYSACTELVPETSGDSPSAIGEEIRLQGGSAGGKIYVADNKAGKTLAESFTYTANGISLNTGGQDSLRVELSSLMKVGTVISVEIYNANDDKARGLLLKNMSKTTKATWTATMTGTHYETYTVVAGDGLEGSNMFLLSRSETAALKSLTVSNCGDAIYDVTFDMKDHGTQVAKQTLTAGAKVAEPSEPEAAGYIFGGWYKETTLENAWNFSTDVVPANDMTLYAKWTADLCTDRQSLSKVVLTSTTAGTVTGHNSDEFAGTAVIGGLSGTATAEVDASHEGTETGYKLASGGSAIVFATLKKGTFQEGDKVVVTITKANDAYKVSEVAQPILDIYYGNSKDDATLLTTINGVSAAGTYTYRLTAADVTAIGDKKGIGVFRPSSGRTQNPHVYSVEITGCRSWTATHTVIYNKMGKGADIAPAVVEEGALVSEPSVTEPEGWILEGWYKEEGLVNKWDFASDVMGTSNITLYAKWVADTSIKLIVDATPSGKKINDEAYYTGSPLTNVTISAVEYPCVKLAGGATAATAPYGAGQNDNRVIAYCATTTATKIQVIAYSSSNSARPYTISFVEEGQTADQADDNNVIVNLPTDGTIHTSDWYQFNSSKNRTIYITIPGNASNYHFLQVKVIESGTPIKKAGDLGYSMNFNIGRPIGVKQTLHKNFEGFDFYANNDYKVLQSTSMAISNATNDYIKFHAAAPMTLAVTTENAASFYVTKAAKGTDNETLSTAGGISYIDLDEAADWYISPKDGEVKIQKIEFIAPKCEQPNVTDMSDSELCEGDPFTALAVSASVSDGGTLHYQWYKHPAAGDDEAVGADAASYTPTADGQYYVVVTNKLADHSDNSKASNTVTVEHFASAVITTAPLNQRGEVGDVVTLSAAATGKNVAYKWYTCDEDGSNEVALDPAQTGTSIDVTITAGLLQWYKVKVTSDCGGAEAKAKVSEFVPTTPANVTTSILWDWASSAWPASGEVQFTNKTEDGTDLTPAYELLADADAIVPNNAAFRSDMLYGKGQWVWRSSNKFFQGTAIKFNTTVAGKVRVNYRSTGNNKEVQVTIAGTPAGKNKTSNFQWSEYVEVPAGDVEIICLSTDEEKSLTRVQKIEFLALAHQRTSGYNAGDLGTVCLEDATFIEGANLYELAGLNENGYLAFDEVLSGELEEGKPYLFEVTNPSKISFYKPVGAAHSGSEIAVNGMIGTFDGTTLYQNVAQNYYYFSGRHIWKVNDFTVAIPIPDHRCYIDYDVLKNAQASPNPAPGRRRVTLGVQGTQVTTDINNVGSDDVQCTKVMIDGQLYILRGEKMYDATGRLVK